MAGIAEVFFKAYGSPTDAQEASLEETGQDWVEDENNLEDMF